MRSSECVRIFVHPRHDVLPLDVDVIEFRRLFRQLLPDVFAKEDVLKKVEGEEA